MKKRNIWELIIMGLVYFLVSSSQKSFNTFTWDFTEGTVLVITIGVVTVAVIETIEYLDPS